jgi:hypothetical protein
MLFTFLRELEEFRLSRAQALHCPSIISSSFTALASFCPLGSLLVSLWRWRRKPLEILMRQNLRARSLRQVETLAATSGRSPLRHLPLPGRSGGGALGRPVSAGVRPAPASVDPNYNASGSLDCRIFPVRTIW